MHTSAPEEHGLYFPPSFFFANGLGLLGAFGGGSMVKSGVPNAVGRRLAGMVVD